MHESKEVLHMFRPLRLRTISLSVHWGRFTVILSTALVSLVAAAPTFADRDQTCKLRGGNQRADYHCPEGFDVVVAGELTDRCDGSGYAKGDSKSLFGFPHGFA